MKRLLALPLLLITLSLTGQDQDQPGRVRQQLARVDAKIAAGPYKADWNSLAAFRVPRWFRDAKFGIFIHWGVYSVPAFANEWYSRSMYIEGSKENRHHVQVYGPTTQFGYKDFIPGFKAERFNPEKWVTLFEKAGAKYVVPVAEHCDGFAMYDSKFTDWTAAKMGPKRDVIAELAKSTRAHGMHFGLSSHRAENWWWYDGGMQSASDVQDPRYRGLYGPASPMALNGARNSKEPDPNHLEEWLPPDSAFLNEWLARSTELVDKYQPEFMYFDWWIGQPAFRPYLQRMAAYYYNKGNDRKQDVLLSYKDNAFPENAALLELERGRLDALRLLPWQTDTSISRKSWGYIENDERQIADPAIGGHREQEWQLTA
jgi:alpha-L-fucosidase